MTNRPSRLPNGEGAGALRSLWIHALTVHSPTLNDHLSVHMTVRQSLPEMETAGVLSVDVGTHLASLGVWA